MQGASDRRRFSSHFEKKRAWAVGFRGRGSISGIRDDSYDTPMNPAK